MTQPVAPSPPPYAEAPGLKRLSMHVRHGFFGRNGGVSTGIYKSLNCGLGSADDLSKVRENRRRVCTALAGSIERLVTLHQIHSARAVVVSEPFSAGESEEADAVVTNRPGLLLGVLAADCAPILLCDAHAGVVAAVHAGWRGAVGGVLERAIDAMVGLGAQPDRMAAAVGPCLSHESFEVGPDMVETLLEATVWAETLLTPGTGDRQFFDLKRYALGKLSRAGVAHAEALADDTLSDAEGYFSHRRRLKRGEPDTGRNLSVISLLA